MDKIQQTSIREFYNEDALRQAATSNFDTISTKRITHSVVPWRQAYVVEPNPQFDNTGLETRPWVLQQMLRYLERVGDITQTQLFLGLPIHEVKELKAGKQLPPRKTKMRKERRDAVNVADVGFIHMLNLRSLKNYGTATNNARRCRLNTISIHDNESITRYIRALPEYVSRKLIEVEKHKTKSGRKYIVIHFLDLFFAVHRVAMSQVEHAISQQKEYQSRKILAPNEAPISRTEASTRYRAKITEHKAQQPIVSREQREEKKELKQEIKQQKAEEAQQKPPLTAWQMIAEEGRLTGNIYKEKKAMLNMNSRERLEYVMQRFLHKKTDPPDK